MWLLCGALEDGQIATINEVHVVKNPTSNLGWSQREWSKVCCPCRCRKGSRRSHQWGNNPDRGRQRSSHDNPKWGWTRLLGCGGREVLIKMAKWVSLGWAWWRRRWLCNKWRRLLVWQAHQEASLDSHAMSEGEPECIVFDGSQAFQFVNV